MNNKEQKEIIKILGILIFWEIFEILIFYYSKYPILILDENQILYLFATGAQVVAGIYGLTITGYIFFNDKLNIEVEKDESLYDIVKSIKESNMRKVKSNGIMVMLTICLCILCIIIGYQNIELNWILQNFIISNTTGCIILTTVLIIMFIFDVIDSNKIEKISDLNKDKMDEGKTEEGSLSDFLKYYNDTEKLVIECAQNIIGGEPYYRKKMGYRPLIMQSLEILCSKEIINYEYLKGIDEIRKYRNYVVHGDNPRVSLEMSEKVRIINKNISSLINEYQDRQLRPN